MLVSFLQTFLYKALGTTLASCQDVAYVKSQLQKFLKDTDYMDASEREQVVSILAFSAKGHLDLTLSTLEDFGAAISKVQVSGIISLLQDFHQGRRGRTHRALIVAYSQIAVHAPQTQLLPRVERDITRRVLQHYMSSCQVLGITILNKDLDLKLTLIRSVTEISRAIQDADGSQSFQFTYKEELLGYMLDFIKEEPMDSLASPVRLTAMLAIKHLSKVKPSLNRDANRSLLETCLRCLVPLPAVQHLTQEGETAQDSLQIQSLHELSMQALGKLMRGLLEEDPTESWVMEMFHLLEPWLSVDKEWERDRALQGSAQLLAARREAVYCRLQEPFGKTGFLLGLLAPYTYASLTTSWLWAADCIACLLPIQAKVPYQISLQPSILFIFIPDQSMGMDAAEEELRGIREELKASTPETVLAASSRMAKVLGKYFPSSQTHEFMETVLNGMLRASPTCVTAGGHWLLSIIKEHGEALLKEVPDILGTITMHMPAMQEGCMKSCLLEAVASLAGFHVQAVTSSLLCRPLPIDSDTSELWRAVGGGDDFSVHVLHLLLAKLDHRAETESSSLTAAFEPLAATCAALEIISTLQCGQVLRDMLSAMLRALVEQTSHTVGQKMPAPGGSLSSITDGQVHVVGNPCRLSMEALACAISKGIGESVAASLCKEGTWPLLECPETHHEGVCQLARALLPSGMVTPNFIKEILKWVRAASPKLRLTGTAFLSQLTSDPSIQDEELLNPALLLLAERAKDGNYAVRQMASRALGNVAHGAPKQLKHHRTLILDTLVQASFVPSSDKLMTEGMISLAKVLSQLGTSTGPVILAVGTHVRAFFDHKDDALRKASFALFTTLAGCLRKRWHAWYKTQVRQSWAALLLHLQDPNKEVAKECRRAVGLCCPYLGLRRVQGVLAFYVQGSGEVRVNVLLRDLCRHLVKEKPALLEGLCYRTRRYYTSSWPEIRAAAIHFTGIMLEYSSPGTTRWLNIAHLQSSLRSLEKDSSPPVQVAATQVLEAISKSPWGRVTSPNANHGCTLPRIFSMFCFGCLRPGTN
ncbi:maestro heat-like repeat-containing protein family member 2B [Alligator mississippiensis]|uniref:maestro heat-like repeat-containing protein family member 2B n=1 Tax=Alligator mississippiensis TaxID=8496 RepID=UPI002877F257|nr:maestro heat-like repeat-containing protein family member 2B [Alligator mississippiensis]